MSKNKSFASLPVLPVLPKLGRSGGNGGPQLPCLCGCGRGTSSRVAPGHDSKILGWTLLVEKGFLSEAPAPHTEVVKVEIALRKAEGLTLEPHAKLQVQREDMAGKAVRKVRKARKSATKAKVVEPVIESEATDEVVEG